MANSPKPTRRTAGAKRTQRETTVARRNNRSTGDYTGRATDNGAKQRRTAAAEELAETTLQSHSEEIEQQNGVFDPKSGDLIENIGGQGLVLDEDDEDDDDLDDDVEESEDDDDEEEDEPQGFGFAPDEPVFTGHETLEEMAPHINKRRERRRERRPARVRNPISRVRIDADIDEMTYGMVNGEPNNFTFREGFIYDVPTAVADHLEERGLIRQWIS